MDGNTISNDVTLAGESAKMMLANRYRIIRQLGQGGMGSVWLAEDTLLDNRQCAVKMLPSILVANKRAYKQLKAEALVSMRLIHPNIVTLRAFEENGGNPFLLMDYIDGITLDEYLSEKGCLTEEETIKLLKPVAEALDYAHAEGVVHRDVKPANIMIRKDGCPFVLDFGIAREIQETMTRVTGKLSSGTLLYMSPEQLNGDSPKPTQDVYSFSAMAYECLSGKPPFWRGGIEDQIKNKPPEPLPSQSNVSLAVVAGLAKQPEGRPATCRAVLEAPATRPIFRRVEPVRPTLADRPETDETGAELPVDHRLETVRQALLLADHRTCESAQPGRMKFGHRVVIVVILWILFLVLVFSWYEYRRVEKNTKAESALQSVDQVRYDKAVDSELSRLAREREDAARKAEEQRMARERAEAERKAEELRRAREKEEADRKAEELRLAREREQAEAERKAEEQRRMRVAEEWRKEEELQRLIDTLAEDRAAEEWRKEEELQRAREREQAEAERKAEEMRKARVAEEQRKAEELRKARVAEEQRKAEELRRAREKEEANRKAEELQSAREREQTEAVNTAVPTTWKWQPPQPNPAQVQRQTMNSSKLVYNNSNADSATVIIRPFVVENGVKRYVKANCMVTPGLPSKPLVHPNAMGGCDIVISGKELPSASVLNISFDNQLRRVPVAFKPGKIIVHEFRFK